jgi:8-oxo-dGTP diphosphatase
MSLGARFEVSVDVAVLTVRQGRLGVLVERIDAGIAAGAWELPHAAVTTSAIDDAAEAVLHSAAGVEKAHDALFVEQLRTYGDRSSGQGGEPTISVAYVALVGESTLVPTVGRVFALDDLYETGVLADGQDRLIDDAVERVRSKFEYTTVATTLVAEPFTIPELRRVYESVWSVTLHPANFRRKVLATPGFVVPESDETGARRGPDLFRRGTAALLHPAMLRPVDAES